jgi:glycosyltransferase involved in cell wall biosynthesis
VNVSVVIATCGDQAWADLAWARAYPSASTQEPQPQIVVEHYSWLSVSQARNAGARSAAGDWLCFLDADDKLEPGYLAAMEAAEPYWRFTVPDSLLVPAVRRIVPDCRETRAGIPNLGRWPVTNECVIGTLVPRRLFEQVGGFRDFPIYEDYDLFLRCFDAGAMLVHVPGAVYRECVSVNGRNVGPLAEETYAEIWAEHERRIQS